MAFSLVMFLNDSNEMCSALNILEIFGNLSGLILNVEKCEGLWLGRSKHLQYISLQFIWN